MEKVALKIKLTIFEYQRDRNIGIYIIKQSHPEKYSQTKLHTSTLVNDGSLRSTADFASALSNVNNVKISDLLAFIVIFVFLSLFSPENHLQNVTRLYKHPLGRLCFVLKKSLIEVFFHLHLHLCLNGYFPMKLPLARKCNRPVPEQVK